MHRQRQSFLEAFGFEKAPGVVISVGDVPAAIYHLGSRVLVNLTPLIVKLVKFQELMYE